jgi:hypothetical protein
MRSVDSRRISHKQWGENMVNINPFGGREDIPQSIQTWDRCKYLTMCMLCVQCLGCILASTNYKGLCHTGLSTICGWATLKPNTWRIRLNGLVRNSSLMQWGWKIDCLQLSIPLSISTSINVFLCSTAFDDLLHLVWRNFRSFCILCSAWMPMSWVYSWSWWWLEGLFKN